jgi:hypothetical protein
MTGSDPLKSKVAMRNFAQGYPYYGGPRQFEAVTAVPFRWPTKATVANEYVDHWQRLARAALSSLRLSCATLETVASHISRRDGTTTLSNRALAARSGRSLCSTERDIYRLKCLGFIVAEYGFTAGRQGRERIIKIAVPNMGTNPQRIPASPMGDYPSTYPLCVEGIDMGDRLDV